MATEAEYENAIALRDIYIAKLEGQVATLQAALDAVPVPVTPPPAEPPPVTPPEPPPVVVPPVVRKTLIGISGVTPVDGFGSRIFDNGKGVAGFTPNRRTKAQCPRVHVSWKGTSVPSDATIIAATRTLIDGDKVEMEHEHDVDYRKAGGGAAAAALAARIAVKDGFHDAIVRLRTAGKIPKVDTVCTLSSFSFMPVNIADIGRYLSKADVIGADLDGDDASVGGYMNYGDPVRLANIRKVADERYKGRWTAPEHGWANTVPGERIAHFKQTIPAIAKFAPEEIMVFNSASFAPVLTAAELVELRAIAKQYNG